MKLVMLCEIELPNDIFRSAKATQRLEPAWLALLDEVNAAAVECGLTLRDARCEHVRPRVDGRTSQETNGSTRTPRRSRTSRASQPPPEA